MTNKLIMVSFFMAVIFGACKSGTNSGNSSQSAIDMIAEGEPKVAEVTGAPKVPAPVGNRGPKNGL